MIEKIQLHYDPRIIEAQQVNPVMALLDGINIPQEMLDSEREDNLALLDYARHLGIETVGHPTSGKENEYCWSPENNLSESEEHDILRSHVPDIQIPKTLNFADYETQPFFPTVAKQIGSSLGQNKYLIETPSQWEKMRLLLNADGPLFPSELALYEGAENPYRNHSHGSFTDTMNFQRFIQTPSKRNTSYRVLVSSVGEIIACSLFYSETPKDQAWLPDCEVPISRIGNSPHVAPFGYLTHPDSYVYLKSRDITSNLGNGGSGIVLNPILRSKSRQPHENEILEAHGISPDYPELPKSLGAMSKAIGQTLGKRLGIIVGIDWIQAQDGSQWYLETNAHPGPQAFADRFHGGMIVDSVYSLRTVNRLMSQAALRSLARQTASPLRSPEPRGKLRRLWETLSRKDR